MTGSASGGRLRRVASDHGPPGHAGRGLPGIAVAGLTAATSGVSVFVNSYGVHAIRSPAIYTTAKNLVAAMLLVLAALGARRVARTHRQSAPARFVATQPLMPASDSEPHRVELLRWVGLAYVGVVGGGIAFVLFFNGLADTSAAPAAFWHDTLVVWVALLALPVLGERLRWWNGVAIVVLVAGQVAVTGGVGHLGPSRGELLVLGATVLWAVEVVVAKIILEDLAPGVLSVVRMGGGSAALILYLVATGHLHSLVSLGIGQAGWALLTGLLLAAYVGTWMTALARARAVDVSSVLVGGAVVTALLQGMAGTASLGAHALGLALVAAGAVMVLGAGWRESVARRTASSP